MTGQSNAMDSFADGEERITDHLELLATMGRDFAASLDIDKTLARAVARITGHLDAAGGALFLLDEAGETLRCHACCGATEITGMTLAADAGIVGRCVQNNVGEVVHDTTDDPGFNPGVDAQTGYTTRSILCAPMSVQDQRIGAIELINKRSGDALFTDDDLHVLQTLASSAALAILNARMAEALVEQERVRRELELAAEIQRSLLPEPGDDSFPVHGVNVPARTVSGDFYDFFALADGRICFNLGDVSGKGMNAALLMAKTASLYRCLGKTVPEPGRLLAVLNDEIAETATRGMFVTMVAGVYDPATGSVRLANAGHEPPLFHGRDDTFTAVPAGAPPLGISPSPVPGVPLPENELNLDGGALYVFTDGVTEGFVDGGDTLEVGGLKALIREHGSATIPVRLAAVIDRITRGDTTLRDDLTILAIDDGREAENRPVGNETSSEDGGEVLLALTVPAQAGRLKQVRGAVAEAMSRCPCDAQTARDLVLAVDEACQNVIRHAYRDEAQGEIVLEIRCEPGRLIFRIRDFAPPIDTGRVRPRDLDDVRPGGLGTHLIREVMDEVAYSAPPGGGNLLRMVKRMP